ncbi:MAG: lamin tail domain-containing protein [Proteobacteria bacterium]|nr:lamin tail domain-containing protein [Pseudomonadota bacterium]
MNAKLSILWSVVAACGCLDLNLLDEMQPLDAGNGEESEYGEGEDNDNTSDGDNNEEGKDDIGDDVGDGDQLPDTDSSDTLPPEFSVPDCGVSELLIDRICVAEGAISASLRFVTDEPTTVSISASEQVRAGILSDEWSTSHHIAVTDLDTENETNVSFEVKDVNGNLMEFEVQISGWGGPPIAITEVLADPFGPEPSQEFIEIANFGAVEVDISGWMIDDGGDTNGDLIPIGTILGPGEVAILVSSAYVRDEGQDPSPESETLIVSLETSICSNGLKNSDAESIELYDAAGVLVSQYKGQAGAPVEGSGSIRLSAELPDSDLLAFELDPNGTSTPGQVPTL